MSWRPRFRRWLPSAAMALTSALALLWTGPRARAERIPLNVSLSAAGFEQIREQDGVRVYKHATSDIIRLGAEGRFAAPPDQVLAALLDYPGHVGVIKRVSESRVLQRGADWLLVYQHLNLPVISDRDFTLRVRSGHTGDLRWIEYNAAPQLGPPARSGIVRVTTHHGSWQLRPIEGGRATFARMQTTIDLGGLLPKWLARSGSGKEVPQLFFALRRLLPRGGAAGSPVTPATGAAAGAGAAR
ncbi:MAG: hypothetical protein IPG96_06520 [Proteobacteria bacterium]|nr:hypothetical protein [Pseudomonadota bacterium]